MQEKPTTDMSVTDEIAGRENPRRDIVGHTQLNNAAMTMQDESMASMALTDKTITDKL